MHEDDDYNDEHDYDDAKNPYKHYFKFDPSAWDAWGKWLQDALNDIVESSPNVWYTTFNIPGFPNKSFPVNSWLSNTGKDKTFQYLGNNYQNTPIWKKKYFIRDSLNEEYIKHIQNHAVHFLNQPDYYNGMFDILN
jgi:hypothetical protein